MRRLFAIELVGLAAVLGLGSLLVAQSVPTASHRAVVDESCVDCHNRRDRVADLALDVLDPDRVAGHVETWEKVIRKLRTRQMPPYDGAGPRPDPGKLDELRQSLERRIDRLAAGDVRPGQPLLGRLNRAEYANAIRDLLGLDVDVSLLLPPDDSAYGFDNVADVLGNSPALLQSYLTAARRISALAVGDPDTPPGGMTYTVRQDVSQDRQLEGLPLGTVGGLAATHIFPVDGEYDFQVRLYRTNLSAIRGLEDPHRLELSVDGERVLLANLGGNEDLIALQANPTAASDALEQQRLHVRVAVKAGERHVGAAFLGEAPALLDTSRLQPFVRDFNPYDAEGAPHVQSLTIEGPFNAAAAGARAAPSPRLFVCRPSGAGEEPACARRILSAVATRAYRRPVTATELNGMLSFYDQGRANADFDAGIQLALRRVLASPSFVFLPEDEPADAAPGTAYRLTDYELATRLSLFLWSSIPDDELLQVAAEGRLHETEVLARQVERMLKAPQAAALTHNFAGQWLHLRNLASIVPSSDLFPDFDDNLRGAFRREAELFFASVLHEDRSVLDLLQSRDTFVNQRLAEHYGIAGVFGTDFRRVQLQDERRYGLLGKGAVLLATSHPNTTSPVLRGKWVLENLIGTPPSPPPPDLDTSLKKGEPGAEPRTMREQMQQHVTNPVCAQCHKVMDPIGFALENFDVTGAWRETTDTGTPLDTKTVMFDGTEIDGVVDLRRALTRHPDVFVQTLTEKLMVYALRRGLTYEDMPTVRRIVEHARERNYRFSALLLEIVDSVPFRMRIKPAAAQSALPNEEKS
jgi:hypothetical protein